MRNLHKMVYEPNNVVLGIRQLSKSKGRMAKGIDGTNYATLEQFSIAELAEIVKDRLINKKMDYVRRSNIPKGNTGKMRPIGICSIWDKLYRLLPRTPNNTKMLGWLRFDVIYL